MDSKDVLQELPAEEIRKLRDLYNNYTPAEAYIYNYLNSVIKWKGEQPDKNYIKVFTPHGSLKDGTFIAIHQYNCYEIFLFTQEKDCKVLVEALISTKKINWNTSVILYAIYHDYMYPFVRSALEKTPFKYDNSSITDVWWMAKENAVAFEVNCPSEVYIDKVDGSHANYINGFWPNRFEDSDKYLETLIEMNGAFGVFLKSNGTLVAWALRNLIGLAVITTLNGYRRKGYGALITRMLAREIAKTGYDPVGTVLQGNVASEKMFANIGFRIVTSVAYVENQERRQNDVK